MTEPPSPTVYDSVPLPLGETMCIRVIKIRPSTTPDFSDTIVCDFSILDVRSGTIRGDYRAPEPLDYHTYIEELKPSKDPTIFKQTQYNVRVSDQVQYQALSYTWGDPTTSVIIQLNDSPFRVRQNLWDFLKQARRHAFPGYLWIDAISINQETLQERNHQVGIMGEIYSRAECVIVWLGKARAHVLHTISASVVPSYRRRLFVSYKQYQSERAVMADFCFLPYWSRAWIVQEYYLAKRKEIWYGWLLMTCNQLEYMVEFWNRKVSDPWISTPAQSLFTTKVQVELARHESGADNFRTFLYLSGLFGRLECADRRDRLYALLPLLSSGERAEIAIIPNYSITTSKIFERVVSRLVREIDLKHNDWSWDAIVRLQRMLRPDVQEKTVQLVILSLRARTARYAVGPQLGVHVCNKARDSDSKLDAQGCSRCHKIPVLLFEDIDPSDRDNPENPRPAAFSRKDWKIWTKALLAGDDAIDRELGTKIRNDRYFRNWDWDVTLDYPI